MDDKLNVNGYVLEPSKYSPGLGYSGLKLVISATPTQRFFDTKLLHLTTFDGRHFRHEQIGHQDTGLNESFRVCMGEIKMEAYTGETMHLFSFGGNLQVAAEIGDLGCLYSSNAPIFNLEDEPFSLGRVIADEILDLLAENEIKLAHHEDDLYLHLLKYEPYQLFLACVVSLQKRVEGIPMSQRGEGFNAVAATVKRTVKIVQDTYGWDGHSPSLEDLIAEGGA